MQNMAAVIAGLVPADVWAAHLTRACAEGALGAALVWLACRRSLRLPAAVRAWLWWLLCLKMTATLLCPSALPLPLLPAASAPKLPAARNAPAVPAAQSLPPDVLSSHAGRLISPTLSPVHAAPIAQTVPSPLLPSLGRILRGLQCLWLLGISVLSAASLWSGIALRRRLDVRPAGWQHHIVVQTDAVSGPLVMGLWRPVILLPRTGLTEAERAMALAHEQAHLRRGDLWLGLMPALTRTLFFFFPPAWWIVREYLQAREEACDAMALAATGAAASDYARLLLRFAGGAAPRPAIGLSAGARSLRRRLLTLPPRSAQWSPMHRLCAAFGLIALLPLALPWRLTAAAETGADPVSASATPPPSYQLTDLGVASGQATEATGLNDQGQVSLCAETTPPSLYGRALTWDRGRTEVVAGMPGDEFTRSDGLNDRGQVLAASYSAYDHDHAFLWDQGRLTPLSGMAGFPYSKALGLNQSGQAVGYVQSGAYDPTRELVAHAVQWTTSGRPQELGTLGGDYSEAYAVNDHGQIVGKSDTTDFGSTHAFLWQDGRMTDLGTLGGTNSLALAISDGGEIVGYADTSSGTHAFLWQDGVMQDLGTLPGGATSAAQSVNAAGQIVGQSDNTAALWQNGKVYDLNALVRGHSGWIVQDATAINARGQIAGRALAPDRCVHAVLLTPTQR